MGRISLSKISASWSGDFGFWILDFGFVCNPKSKIQNPKTKLPPAPEGTGAPGGVFTGSVFDGAFTSLAKALQGRNIHLLHVQNRNPECASQAIISHRHVRNSVGIPCSRAARRM
jgi:hypothetical protein